MKHQMTKVIFFRALVECGNLQSKYASFHFRWIAELFYIVLYVCIRHRQLYEKYSTISSEDNLYILDHTNDVYHLVAPAKAQPQKKRVIVTKKAVEQKKKQKINSNAQHKILCLWKTTKKSSKNRTTKNNKIYQSRYVNDART